MVDIWSPTIYIGNSVKLDPLGAFGDDSGSLSSIWFHLPSRHVQYSEVFITSLSCDFDFTTYPFDKHVCFVNLKNWIGGSFRIRLNAPKLLTLNSEGDEIGGENLTISNQRLDYDCMFRSVPSEIFVENGEKYYKSLIKIDLSRTIKSRQKIEGSFHLTTGIFAALSLISFSINADVVPGRMGLLITLYLILVNTYISVKAPSNRGFSLIEVWFIGTQAPVLFAILEYGTLLTIKKFCTTKDVIKIFKMTMETVPLFKTIDILSFFISAVFQMIFNLWYWNF